MEKDRKRKAQEQRKAQRESSKRRKQLQVIDNRNKILMWVVISLVLLDALLTGLVLDSKNPYVFEGNPIARDLFDTIGLAPGILLFFVVVSTFFFFGTKLMNSSKKKLPKVIWNIVLWLNLVVRVFAVTNNAIIYSWVLGVSV